MNLLQQSLSKTFRMKIANAGGEDKIIAFFAGYISTLGFTVTQDGADPFAVTAIDEHQHNIAGLLSAGVAVDAVIDDGLILADITCTAMSSENTIRSFKEYIKHNPLLLDRLIISADNKSYFDESIVWGELSPLVKQNSEDAQQLEPYFDPYQNQDNKISIPFKGGLLLDQNRLMYANIPAGRTVTFTFNFK